MSIDDEWWLSANEGDPDYEQISADLDEEEKALNEAARSAHIDDLCRANAEILQIEWNNLSWNYGSWSPFKLSNKGEDKSVTYTLSVEGEKEAYIYAGTQTEPRKARIRTSVDYALRMADKFAEIFDMLPKRTGFGNVSQTLESTVAVTVFSQDLTPGNEKESEDDKKYRNDRDFHFCFDYTFPGETEMKRKNLNFARQYLEALQSIHGEIMSGITSPIKRAYGSGGKRIKELLEQKIGYVATELTKLGRIRRRR